MRLFLSLYDICLILFSSEWHESSGIRWAAFSSLTTRLLCSSTPPLLLRSGVIDPESLANLLKRPWDPLAGLFVQHRLRKIPANPIILMAPDAPTSFSSAHSPKRKKFWHNQLTALGKVIPISSGVHSSGSGVNASAAAQQSLENMINAMRAKVGLIGASNWV